MSGSFWKVSIEWLSCFGLRIRSVTQRTRRIRCLGRCDARRVIGLTRCAAKTDRVATTSEATGMTSPAVTPTSPEPTRGGSQRPTRWRWRRLPKCDVDEPLATSRMRRDWSMMIDVKLCIYAFMIDRRSDVRNDVTVLSDNDASDIRSPTTRTRRVVKKADSAEVEHY